MEDLQKKYNEDFILFLEAGFIAVNHANEDAAIKLFNASKFLDPKNSLVDIGFGYLHLHKLELPQAIKYFEEVAKKEPENDMAKVLLGIAKSFSLKDQENSEQLLKAGEDSPDKEVREMAHMAEDFVDKFIKKEPSPAEVKKPKGE